MKIKAWLLSFFTTLLFSLLILVNVSSFVISQVSAKNITKPIILKVANEQLNKIKEQYNLTSMFQGLKLGCENYNALSEVERDRLNYYLSQVNLTCKDVLSLSYPEFEVLVLKAIKSKIKAEMTKKTKEIEELCDGNLTCYVKNVPYSLFSDKFLKEIKNRLNTYQQVLTIVVLVLLVLYWFETKSFYRVFKLMLVSTLLQLPLFFSRWLVLDYVRSVIPSKEYFSLAQDILNSTFSIINDYFWQYYLKLLFFVFSGYLTFLLVKLVLKKEI